MKKEIFLIILISVIFPQLVKSQEPEQINYEVFIIPSNHWDRVWQMPFEVHRMTQVNFMDHLLETMESKPGFKYFTLDGQTSLIDDYLEIRPENANRVKNLINDGRLLSGPWYTQPNVFMVSGESIIRNFYLGITKGAEYGKVMKLGYCPDAFGLNSQLPQILNGFGIQDVFFWRGIPQPYEGLFKWFGSDGSFCYAFNSRYSEGDGMIRPTLKEDYGSNENFLTEFDNYFQERKEVLEPPFVVIVNGGDMRWATVDLPEKVDLINNHYSNVHARVSNFPELIREIRDYYEAKNQNLKTYTGEIREYTGTGAILTASQSTRTDLKIALRNAENLLEKYAEPTAAFNWLSGYDYPSAELNKGWFYLLNNQHHDNTAGASHDNDYYAVMAAMQRVEEIGEQTTWKSTSVLAKNIVENMNLKDGEFGFVAINTLGWERNGVQDLVINIPLSANIRTPALVDGKNEYLMYPDEIKPNNVYSGPEANRYKVSVPLNDIPPFGYKAFKIIDKADLLPTYGSSVYIPKVWEFYLETSLKTGVNQAENEYLKLSVNADGTLDIHDKRTGHTYRNVHYFQDDGEAGTGFERRRPIGNEVITTFNSPARISLIHNNPYKITYCIEWNLKIPKEIDDDYENRRLDERVNLKIKSYVTLRAGKPRVDIETIVNNTAKDHRLRVCFPTYLDASSSWAEQPFDVVRHPVPIEREQYENQGSYWCPVDGSHPMTSFVDLSDGDIGLMVCSDLALYEVIADSSRTIQIDLIRGLDRIHLGNIGRKLEVRIPDAQMLGEQRFHYSIIPHEGKWESAIQDAYEFHAPLHIATPIARGSEIEYLKNKGNSPENMPGEYCFIDISNKNLIVSAVKKHEQKNALVVRLYNPGETTQKATCRINPLTKQVKNVQRINLLEEPVPDSYYDTDNIKLSIEPKKIITLMVEMEDKQ